MHVHKEKRFLLTLQVVNKHYIYFNFEQFPLVPANCICRFESSKEMHIVCKKLIWTLNIIFVQVYPCDKHLQSQKLEWKCFVHFSVKEFLYNIFLSLLLDSVLRSVIPFPHSRFNILRLPSSPLKCALVYRKILFRWSSNYVFIAKEIRQTRALQVYVIKETTGNVQRSDLYEATR